MTSTDFHVPYGFGAETRRHWSTLRTVSAAVGGALVRVIDRLRGPSQLSRLNDHLLRDIGTTRAEAEIAGMYWPLRPPS